MKFAKKDIITITAAVFTLAAVQEAVAQTRYQSAANSNATYSFVGVQYFWQERESWQQDGYRSMQPEL